VGEVVVVRDGEICIGWDGEGLMPRERDGEVCNPRVSVVGFQ